MSADKSKGVDSFRTVPTNRPSAPAVTKAPTPPPVTETAPESTTPPNTPVKPTGKALRAAIAKSNKELDDAPVVVTTYGAERRKNGTSGLWSETDVTEQVLAKTGNK